MSTKTKIRKVKQSLKFELTEVELLAKGKGVAELHKRLTEVEGKFDQVKSQFKADIEELNGDLDRTISCLRDGVEHRVVECDEVLDFATNEVSYVYEGETKERRAMLAHERQMSFGEGP